MTGELLLPPEGPPTLLAAVLLQSKVDAQVVLHGQLVGIGVVANRAVVFTSLVRVLVVDQTPRVAVGPSTLVAGVRSRVAVIL